MSVKPAAQLYKYKTLHPFKQVNITQLKVQLLDIYC